MHASSSFVFAILALVRLALATPPACLIAAMGVQVNPADLKALCGSLESQVVGNITEKCSGDAYSAATSIYAATCLSSASVTISITPTTTSKASTGTGSAKTTGSVTTTGTGASAATNTGSTATGSGATSSTTSKSGAGSNAPQLFFGALALGITMFLA